MADTYTSTTDYERVATSFSDELNQALQDSAWATIGRGVVGGITAAAVIGFTAIATKGNWTTSLAAGGATGSLAASTFGDDVGKAMHEVYDGYQSGKYAIHYSDYNKQFAQYTNVDYGGYHQSNNMTDGPAYHWEVAGVQLEYYGSQTVCKLDAYGTAFNDILKMCNSSKSTVHGGDGNDTEWGMDNQDQLFGDNGGDKLYGGGGADYVNGGNGDDFIFGDASDDRLRGGDGKDQLTGGTGSDEFVLGTNDTVMDFREGSDHATGDDGTWSIGGSHYSTDKHQWYVDSVKDNHGNAIKFSPDITIEFDEEWAHMSASQVDHWVENLIA